MIGRLALLAAAVGGGVAVRRELRGRRRAQSDPATRWRAVTIALAPDEVRPGGRWPAPLEQLGDAVDVRVQPAPGDKGTELAVRLRAGDPAGLSGTVHRLAGTDPRQQVRAALRETKQLLEVGEVLRVEPVHGTRSRTATGWAVDAADRLAGREGVL